MKISKIIGLIIIASVVVYSNSMENTFEYDDVSFIQENISIRDLSNLPRLLTPDYFELSKERTYRPVCTLTFFLDYALWKLNVRGWHTTNLLLHTASAVMLFLIVLILLRDKTAAAAAGLLFAIHPVQTEAVLGISFREDLLSLFFCLGTLLAYLAATGYVEKWKRKIPAFIISFICCVLAVYSKETALVIPVILILCDFCFRKEMFRNPRKHLLYDLYFLVVASFFILKYTVMRNTSIPAAYPGGSILTAILTMSRVVVFYIKLLLYPINLNVDYVFDASKSIMDPRLVFPVLVLAAITYFTVRMHKKNRGVTFAVGFFIICLAPVSNIIPFGAILAERYLYFPSVGFYILAGIIASFFLRSEVYKEKRNTIIVILVLVVLSLSVRTIIRNIDWKDGFSLWEAALKQSPGSYTVHNNLGVAYKKKGMIEEALEEYRKTIELNPSFVRAINNTGYIYYERKQYAMAEAEYKKAIAIKPDFAEGYLNLGLVRYARRDYRGAIDYYNKSLELDPYRFMAYSNLIAAHAQVGEYDKAAEAFRKGEEVNPDFADLYKNMGLVHKILKDNLQALIYWKKYLQIYPGAPDAVAIQKEIDRMKQ